MRVMSNYRYDNLKEIFAGFAQNNSHLGLRMVRKFIIEHRKNNYDFPSEGTVYNWYYAITSAKRSKRGRRR
jgi:hypothetical protein